MCLETMEKAFQWRRKSNLEVTDKQSRIQIPESEVRIRESGSVPNCHGTWTLISI